VKLLMIAVVMATAAFGADISGPWQGAMTGGGGNAGTYVVFQMKAGQVTGTFGADKTSPQQPIENGRIAGSKVNFRETMHFPGPVTVVFDYDLTLDGDAMHGTFTISNGKETQQGKAEFKRAK
jgi:hypothetical protein